MNISQRLRKLADSTGLDAFGDEIRAIADEMDACGSAGTQSDPQAGLTFTGATQPAEVTDGLVEKARVETFQKTGADLIPEVAATFARAILALRPVQAPMTDEQMWDLWNSQGVDDMIQHEAIAFARAVEAHHGITAQAKKETP